METATKTFPYALPADLLSSLPVDGLSPEWFPAWRAAWEVYRNRVYLAVLGCLVANGTVREALFGVKNWRKGSGPFVEPNNSDPEYLADHLLSRFSFGSTLTILEPGIGWVYCGKETA